MLASLVPFMTVILVLPLYTDRLNDSKFIGFPLSYFLCLHKLVLIAVVTVTSFVNQQNAINH